MEHVYATYQIDGDILKPGIRFSGDPERLPAKFVTVCAVDVVTLTFRHVRG